MTKHAAEGRHPDGGSTLGERDATLAQIVEQSAEGIALADLSDRLRYVNRAFATLHGYEPDELIGRPLSVLHTPEQMPAVEAAIARIHATGQFVGELARRRRDGTTFSVLVHNRLFRDVHGKPIGLISTLQNTARERWAQEELGKSERDKSVILAAVSELVRYQDRDLRVIWANKASGASVGLAPEALVGRYCYEVWEGRDTPCPDCPVVAALETGVPRQAELPGKDNRTWLMRGYPVRDERGEIAGVVAVTQDVTARKQAELALRESEQKYRSLYENLRDGLATVDLAGKIIECNPAFEQMLGYTAEELRDKTCNDITPPQWWADEQRIVTEQVLRRGYSDVYRKELICKDGTILPVEMRAYVRRSDAGELLGLWSLVWNVSERERALAALRTSEARFRAIFDYAGIGIALGDLEGRMVECNPACSRLLDFEAEELKQKTFLEITHPDDRAASLARYRQLVAGNMDSYRTEKRYLRKNGEPIWTTVTTSLLRDADGAPRFIVGMAEDISERKRAEAEKDELEARLRQSQKLEAIGQLAGGVAHDFNNLLTAILVNVELLQSTLQKRHNPDPAVTRSLAQIDQAGQRAAALTRQLLAFSRRQIVHPQVLHPNRVLGDLENMLRRLLPENILFELRLAPDTSATRIDAGQLEQVILNLAVNARDALADGGELVIATGNAVLDELTAGPHAEPGPYVQLSVRDTGCGMSPETLERIFEPFFTTKPVGQGTGLGLATVFGIVRQANGHIHVDSAPGRGTCFTVYLPATGEAVTPEEAAETTEEVVGGSETILLCEDDESVRTPTCAILRGAGYNVLVADSGAGALQLGTKHAGPLHMLLTDVILPETNGREVATALQARRPGLRVLYVSGYTADVLDHHGVATKGVELLEKPFTLRGLLRRVRQILDSPPPDRPPR